MDSFLLFFTNGAFTIRLEMKGILLVIVFFCSAEGKCIVTGKCCQTLLLSERRSENNYCDLLSNYKRTNSNLILVLILRQ